MRIIEEVKSQSKEPYSGHMYNFVYGSKNRLSPVAKQCGQGPLGIQMKS